MHNQQDSNTPSPPMTLRVEFVGVIAVACLIIGAIIGSSFAGGGCTSEYLQTPVPGDGGMGGLSAMISQIEEIDDVDQLIHIGNSAYDSRNPQVAIPAYEKALRLQPDNADVLTDLGVMYREMRDYRQAVDHFRRAMAVDPNHSISRFNLGVSLMQDIQDYSGAREAFEEVLRVSPTGTEAERAKKSIEELKKLEE